MIRVFARTRQAAGVVGVLLILALPVINIGGRALFGQPPLAGWPALVVALLGAACLLFSVAATAFSPASTAETLALSAPVRGRWMALNSPTSNVPSHGTHGYGQAFAVDLLIRSEPAADDSTPPARTGFISPSAFPSFGQPILAPAPAVVARVYDRARDHLSRTSPWALFYLYLESTIRDFLGTKRMLGNHVVLRLADGTHFVFAHLRRGSVRVAVGQSVSLGEVIGECGNSGNSTEPHLHCQRQDVESPGIAVGLPWTISPGGIPENLQFLGEPDNMAHDETNQS